MKADRSSSLSGTDGAILCVVAMIACGLGYFVAACFIATWRGVRLLAPHFPMQLALPDLGRLVVLDQCGIFLLGVGMALVPIVGVALGFALWLRRHRLL